VDIAGTWYSKGITCTDSGNNSGAIEAFGKAIALEPDYFEAWDGQSSNPIFFCIGEGRIEGYYVRIQVR
jgi:hypothetical protein